MKPFQIKINNIIFTEKNFRELMGYSSPGTESIYPKIVRFLDCWADKNNWIETATSGSAGLPEKIRLSKKSMELSAKRTCSFFNLSENSSALLCLPVEYIAGRMMLVRAMVAGFNLIVTSPSGNPFENIETSIDFAAITPYQLYKSVEEFTSGKVRQVIVGGAPVTTELEARLQHLPVEIFETYGMTETCSHVALRKLNGKDKSTEFRTLSGVEIAVDSRQCLVINDPGVLTKPVVTNDLVEITSKKTFKWLGRIDNVINSGGIKIFPEQVEKKIAALVPRNFYINSLEDKLLNNKVILVLEGEKLPEKEEKNLLTKIKKTVSPYEMPKEIRYVNKFEATGTGKIKRTKAH